jgi:inner membrane protein
MDNLTHSLIGAAIGRSVPHADAKVRRAVFWTAVLGSNFPDLDFIIPPLVGGGKVAYLLHHRGHTHTFLLAPLLGALAAWAAARIARPARVPWKLLLGVGALSAALHVAADGCNDYGVHPYWPFVNRWFYGDFIFIIEPLLFFALLPLLALEARARWARWTWAAIGAGMLGLLAFGPFGHPAVAAWVTAWAAALLLLQRRRPGGVAVAWAASAAVYVAFFAASQVARGRAEASLARAAPGEVRVQLATTPAPGNPFCWRAIAASRSERDYVARIGAISLLPSILPPESCTFGIDVPRTAPVRPTPGFGEEAGVRWAGEFRGTLDELRELAARSCTVSGFLRYARIPFWNGGVAGDLRYDREPGLGFAETEIAGPCLAWLPPWTPPFPLEEKAQKKNEN